MTLLSTKNTFAVIDLIKQKMIKILFVLNIILDVVFAGYYVFLVVQNREHVVYIVLYSLMIAITLGLLAAEIYYRHRKDETQKIRKAKKKQKQYLVMGFKIATYLVKLSIIITAFVQIATGQATEVTVILTILSAILLLLLLIADVSFFFIGNCIEAVKLAVQEDINASDILKFAHPIKAAGQKMNEIADQQEGVEKYTKQEKQMLDAIHAQAAANKEKEDAQVRMNLKTGIARLKANREKKKEEKRRQKALKEQPTVKEVKEKETDQKTSIPDADVELIEDERPKQLK